MNTVNNKEGLAMARMFDEAGIILLLAHFFAICYEPFQPQGPLGTITDRLHDVVTRLSWVADDTKAKLVILLLAVISAFAFSKPATRRVDWRIPTMVFATGLLLYFSTIRLTPVGSSSEVAYYYAGITLGSYLLILFGLGRLARARSYAFSGQHFAQDTSGFKQEEKRIDTPHSLNFPAKYEYNGKVRNSYINLVNPRRGVLIMGLPGSGKSWFIVEPAIEQLIQKGTAIFIYDFKYPTLTNIAYDCFSRYQARYPDSVQFYCVNFTDLSRSHRCNLIDPATLQFPSDAEAVSRTILLSMNKIWVSKQGDFFVESSIRYLASLIWFLKVYEGGRYCTLPHVIELSKVPYDELFTILNAEPSTRGFIIPFKEAYMNKTMEMLDGQISTARIPLGRLDSKDIYYVLSGNDVDLGINDIENPAILCLGSDSRRHDALSPVISLYIDRLNKQVNHANGYPMALVLDEFATVRATSILDTIATGRSNDISTILAIQDLSQLKQRYSHDEAEQILNTAGNLLCGQIVGESANLVSQRFHANFNLKTTISVNSSDISTSKTEQMVDAVAPSSLANLSSGEFIGMIADDPGKKIKLKGFHASFTKKTRPKTDQPPLPLVHEVTDAILDTNYALVGQQVADLVKLEMKRILGDPELRRFVVRR
ncbi:MAG TPA: YWFCY domain-containing protein [Puia sp.]|nr:YWFCY domain-containing protein [Puia sp.]